jgi:hypothetical protein
MDSFSIDTSSPEESAAIMAAIIPTVINVPMIDAIKFPTSVAQTVFQKVIISYLN